MPHFLKFLWDGPDGLGCFGLVPHFLATGNQKKRKNGETRNIYSNLNFLAWGQQGCLTSSTPHDIGLSHAPPAKILAEN